MRKLLNNPLFVAALALAAVVLIGWKYLPGGRPPVVPGPGAEVVEEEPPAGEQGEPARRVSVVDALKALAPPPAGRDPFALPPKPVLTETERGVGATTEIVERLRVSAIWVQGAAVYVLANGQVRQPGEAVDRFTVESAGIDGAWIAHAAGRSFVPVGGEYAVKFSVPSLAVPLSK